ncbi:type II secretion system minor pseudopilin GspJ [Thiomicrorhabdus sp. zzn3]|uniref:type II secretion system minor pseudopilin GspJ n=1 Tax=Thiomicrorhabdus sp. zzn3 TaxID=3039775 RepID=UPI0024373395|nr:type II secretion system minor pseudopilin GspJ [Thiomicrorhabdus sp. zzn3]MDG6777322.1 type II secretion system minor pseudopilin GspJ [Thiomicrorhabdus sp. zzn3]
MSMNKGKHLDHRQRGFTLIELLIALSVSAVIAVIAYQAVSSVVTLQTRTEAHADDMDQLQRAMWWMEQDFIQLAPRTVQDGLGGTLPAFQYREDLGVEFSRLAEFVTPYGRGGVIRVAYQWQDDILYRLVWPVLDRAPDTQPTRLPILQGVEEFELRLMNIQNVYVESWPGEQQLLTALPKLTEVRLKLKGLGEITRLFMGVDTEGFASQSGASTESAVTETAADAASETTP